MSARLAAFPPWPDALLVDTAQPLDESVAAVLAQVARQRQATTSPGA